MTARLTPLLIDYCGELHHVDADSTFCIGRDADLVIDDNPYLHRRFLTAWHDGQLWWLGNIGSQLSATVSDADGRFEAWVAPGGQLPIVFEDTVVRFTAGPTSYELLLRLDMSPFAASPLVTTTEGETTIGRTSLTPDQKRLIVALAEPALRGQGRGSSAMPSSSEAAARLGWTTTKFNRKLDNVCEKLERQGVRGLHGNPDRLATSRRARLVEYALAVRLVTVDDLALLDVGEPRAAEVHQGTP